MYHQVGGVTHDASTKLDEKEWYRAPGDWGFLSNWCQKWPGTRDLFCVDVFSSGKKLSKKFMECGYKSAAYDIKNEEGSRCDITSREGFLHLLDLGMKLLGYKKYFF